MNQLAVTIDVTGLVSANGAVPRERRTPQAPLLRGLMDEAKLPDVQ